LKKDYDNAQNWIEIHKNVIREQHDELQHAESAIDKAEEEIKKAIENLFFDIKFLEKARWHFSEVTTPNMDRNPIILCEVKNKFEKQFSQILGDNELIRNRGINLEFTLDKDSWLDARLYIEKYIFHGTHANFSRCNIVVEFLKLDVAFLPKFVRFLTKWKINLVHSRYEDRSLQWKKDDIKAWESIYRYLDRGKKKTIKKK
jgi:hypothetical protein